MKKKTTEISTNTSSGAEKVENIEKEVKKEDGKVKKSVVKKTEQENKAADERVQAALKRKEEKEKRKAKRKANIEKRKAERKARAEKRAAERKALAEKRAAEKEARIRERAHAKANRNNANAKKKANKKKSKEGKEKGYGGWIAAVVSLGVVSLALATTVTVGAVEMNKGKSTLMGAYRSTMYELTELMENVDGDLDRVRISASPAQQSRILTDLLVQARLAELDVEKLPIDAESNRNLTIFINHIAEVCERLLAKIRNGEQLNEMDRALLEKLYQTNNVMKEEIASLTSTMTDKDLMDYVKKGTGGIKSALDKLEKVTLEENRDKIENKLKEGKDKLEEGKDKIEEKIKEGKDKLEEKGKEMAGAWNKKGFAPVIREKNHIEAAKAEELCLQYFDGYKITEFQCVGETVTRGYAAYNVQGYDDRGNLLFAEVSQEDGALMRFDYYEDCSGETFDIRNAERIAEEFLEKLGYEDMEVVRVRANANLSDFTFVYEDDGVVYYPDEIVVKVCRTRGVVSGFDATKYLQNHKDRDEVSVNLSLSEAYEKLYKDLSVESSRLVVIKTFRGERPAYEFLCNYEGENYFVFLDANSGEEISIVNVKSIG